MFADISTIDVSRIDINNKKKTHGGVVICYGSVELEKMAEDKDELANYWLNTEIPLVG